ncbi:DUF3489 domain-containing protein [Sphingomonas sp. Leaf33]|uniref:DUF3489 domain-containing protein n=1 Tax=Sphingomonas sp. Leaf33 TaxID=1736215 RepID=UPI0009EB60CB|nr:DUF3489 domain-containing protein [Sphingomonas sp. Leaf33]
MPKLNDIQTILLSVAAQRSDGSLLPPPASLTADPDKITKAVGALIKQGLALELPVIAEAHIWRVDAERHYGATLTDEGRQAIGIEPEGSELLQVPQNGQAPVVGSHPAPTTKATLALSLLRREQGATLAELIEATSWLPHTARAALSGIRKKGHSVAKGKRGDVTCYSLAA